MAAEEEGEEPNQVEQGGDHRAEIVDESRATDQTSWPADEVLANDKEMYALLSLGQARLSLGEYEKAAELLTRPLAFHAAQQHTERAAPVEVIARRWWAQALAELGRFAEAAHLAREAIERRHRGG